MDRVIVTKYSLEPPSRPIILNDVLYDKWLNVETGEYLVWDGEKWKEETMNTDEFMNETVQGHDRSMKLLQLKALEYSDEGGNRLSQFYRISQLKEETPTEVLTTLAAKHFTSICDMARDPLNHPIEQWNEKITDLRNYTHLLDALIRDMGVSATTTIAPG